MLTDEAARAAAKPIAAATTTTKFIAVENKHYEIEADRLLSGRALCFNADSKKIGTKTFIAFRLSALLREHGAVYSELFSVRRIASTTGQDCGRPDAPQEERPTVSAEESTDGLDQIPVTKAQQDVDEQQAVRQQRKESGKDCRSRRHGRKRRRRRWGSCWWREVGP